VIGEIAFFLLLTVVAFVAATAVARKPKSAPAGVALGTTVGLTIGVGLPTLFGFLGYVIPFGQLKFWFWTQYYNVFG
jgi:hypothetical protein